MKNKFGYISLLLLLSFSIFAQIPANYYTSVIGKKQAELKTALHLIIKNANVPSYGSGSGSTWAAFTKTDVRPEDGTVWDMYSANHVAFNGNSAASGMNIEHSFAKSWWGGGRQAAQDVQHLCPSNTTANSSKGSWPMAVVDGKVTYSNGVIKVGKSSSRPGEVIDAWEPTDEYKGDFARMYMYMVTAYEDYATLWTGNSVNQLDNNTYPVFEKWTVDLLLKWSKQDPISQKEITRTNEVYKIQGNRNPYIDFPLMGEYVWGNLINTPFSTDGNVSYPYLNYPTNGSNVDFGKIYNQMGSTSSLNIKATNLTGDLRVTLGGINAANFSVSQSTITKTQAEDGCVISLNYLFASIGTHNATVTLSGGGIEATTIHLKGISSDEFTALPASNITSTGFNANWTSSVGASGYLLDVFTLQGTGATQPISLLQEGFNVGLPASWTSEVYNDNQTSGFMRLASGSSGGSITTPALDLSKAGTTLTVGAKQYNTDNGAVLTVSIDNQPLTTWVTSVANQDFTVNIPATTASSKISFSATAGSRLYVDYVKVESQGALQTPVSVSGYPLQLGNVNYSTVSSLQPNTDYYYVITPIGNLVTASNRILSSTLLSDGLNRVKNITLSWSVLSNGLLIRNLPQDCTLNVFTIMGRKIQTLKPKTAETMIRLEQKGIYLVQVQEGAHFSYCKVMY